MMNIPWQDIKGYTLTELAVVVGIIGLMTAITIPSFNLYLPHLRLISGTSDIATNIRLARTLAIAKNVNYQFTASTNKTFTVECSAPCATPPKDGALASDITYSITTPSGGTAVLFKPTGQKGTDGDTILTVSSPKETKKICVNFVGKVKIVSGTIAPGACPP